MLALLLLALALAMDAFAVSLARGAAGSHRPLAALETGAAFGIAQGIMPAIGWAARTLFLDWIEAFDHWVAFALLSFLGLRMVRGAFWAEADDREDAAVRGHWWGLLAAAVATSIDAAAAGLTLGLFAAPVWLSCLVIGLVTGLLCIAGYRFAARIGARLGRWAECAGGVVLIALGVRILLQHTGWI